MANKLKPFFVKGLLMKSLFCLAQCVAVWSKNVIYFSYLLYFVYKVTHTYFINMRVSFTLENYMHIMIHNVTVN